MRIYKAKSEVPPDPLREALGLTSKLIEFNPNHDERGQFSSGPGGGGGGAWAGKELPKGAKGWFAGKPVDADGNFMNAPEPTQDELSSRLDKRRRQVQSNPKRFKVSKAAYDHYDVWDKQNKEWLGTSFTAAEISHLTGKEMPK